MLIRSIANVLIPFVVDFCGLNAAYEIQTYSGRVLKVLSVTENGVTVREGGRTYRLRSGNIKNVLPQTASFKFAAQSESGVVKVKRDGEFDVKTMSYVKGETDGRAEYLVKAQVKSGNVKMM